MVWVPSPTDPNNRAHGSGLDCDRLPEFIATLAKTKPANPVTPKLKNGTQALCVSSMLLLKYLRAIHGEAQRWFERLPMHLLEEPKRRKVLEALTRAFAVN